MTATDPMKISWRLSFLFPTHDIADGERVSLWMRHLQVYKHWGHVYMNLDIFETEYFLSPFVSMGSSVFLESGFKAMRYWCPDVLVSCERKADLWKKDAISKNIQIRVDVAWFSSFTYESKLDNRELT